MNRIAPQTIRRRSTQLQILFWPIDRNAKKSAGSIESRTIDDINNRQVTQYTVHRELESRIRKEQT